MGWLVDPLSVLLKLGRGTTLATLATRAIKGLDAPHAPS
jgi:hypothetical protein